MAPIYDQWAICYDLSEGDRSAIVEFYRSLVAPDTRSLLELGCGTGVITAALGSRMAQYNNGFAGLRLTGLDESAEMLRIARARSEPIEWVLGDFRAPPVSGKYDLVICCFNVLQMLLNEDDVGSALRGARHLLAPGGRFAFDIYQPNLAYLRVPQTNRLVRSVTDDRGRIIELRENAYYDSKTRVLDLDWRLVERGGAGSLLGTLHNRMRQYFPAEIEGFVTGAGLVIKERYGDFDRSPFTTTSKKQILICGRAA
jgi:SAM-dependent methyltransferase